MARRECRRREAILQRRLPAGGWTAAGRGGVVRVGRQHLPAAVEVLPDGILRTEQDRVREEIKKEDDRLAADPTYQQVIKDLAAAQASVCSSGETAKRIAALDARARAASATQHHDVDLTLRIVKSQLEEAWYDYDSAILEHTADRRSACAHRGARQGEGGDPEGLRRHQGAARQDRQGARRGALGGQEPRGQAEADSRREHDRLHQKLENLTLSVGPFALPEDSRRSARSCSNDFERNNFDKPVARVDRCESCHAGIDKAGFDDAPNPYKTHPHREQIFGKAPAGQVRLHAVPPGTGRRGE